MTPAPYDLIMGLDRADQKADLDLIATATGQAAWCSRKRRPKIILSTKVVRSS